MIRGSLVVAVLTALLCGCADSDDSFDAASAAEQSSASAYPWTDCGAIRAGDALDYGGTRCNPEEVEYFTVDCVNGTYVHLSRPELGDLEGIDGVTPWRAAAPLDVKRGGTAWAFDNCREQG